MQRQSTFPTAFNAVPNVIATARSDPGFPEVADTFVVSARRVSAAQVVFNIVRVDTPAGWAQNLIVEWIAWQ